MAVVARIAAAIQVDPTVAVAAGGDDGLSLIGLVGVGGLVVTDRLDAECTNP